MKNILTRNNDTGVVSALSEISKILVKEAGGFYQPFVEEDVTGKVASISITQNGDYLASDEVLYGYTSANVDIDFERENISATGMTYKIHIDSTNKPHISISRSL